MMKTMTLALGAALLVGCPSTDPDGTEPDPGGQATLTLVGDYGPDAGKTFPGMATVPNLDDDNGNGTPDWAEDGGAEGDNDFSEFDIPADIWRLAEEDDTFLLTLRGQVRNFRVYHDGEVILGEVEGDNLEEWEVPPSTEALSFQVEARDFRAEGSIVLERLRDGESLDNDWFWLTASPLILNHHLQETEEIWVVHVDEDDFYNNNHMVETYADVMGDLFTAVPDHEYGGDVWIQDEIQIGWMNAPGIRTDLTIDSIRNRGLDDFPEDYLEGPDSAIGTWGNTSLVNSLDSFGNLEVSPPVTVDGVDYPFGRIYFGTGSTRYPARELTDFLEEQSIQAPFYPDTNWLCVGHIDEVTSTVPDPNSRLGFKFAIGDIPAAWDVLEQLPESMNLPRYGRTDWRGHSLPTVGSIVNSNALRMENEEIQEDILDPMLDQFSEELGLTDEDIIRIPSLFESLPGCGDAALIPGMVNMIVANRDEQTDIFLADPFMRDSDSPTEGQDEDAIIEAMIDAFPDTTNLHFVDNWAVYHMQLGEVHCGTNMMRTPSDDWWSVAGHLLGGE